MSDIKIHLSYREKKQLYEREACQIPYWKKSAKLKPSKEGEK